MYKHIIWDFDGTLFDSYPTMAGLFKIELEKMGFKEPLADIMALMQVSMSHATAFYKEKYGIDNTFIAEYNRQRTLEEPKECKPFEDASQVCIQVSHKGNFNYLYTHRGYSAIEMIQQHHLDPYFRDYITCEDGFERKPSPNAILHLISKHGMNPSETLMIGDRELDILAAKHAGADACFYNKNGVECIRADINIKGFKELFELI